MRKKLIFLGIFFAILFHGLLDFLLLTKTGFAVFVIAVIILLGFLVRGNLKKAELQSMMRLEQENSLSSVKEKE
uniref:Uncharacterized protein n=1 Tax=candidate division WOR-3 bacterium TaxID=2052148 RepID=A0A7C4TI81_UNCW3